jgi:hypothetical protein
MNTAEAFATGIAPGHLPALVAGLVLPLLLFAARRVASRSSRAAALLVVPVAVPLTDAVGAYLLTSTAGVHLALPLTHHDSPWLAAALLGSGVAFGFLAMRAFGGRRWRLPAALLTGATLVAYLVSVGGGEEPDQVGLATAMVELVVLGLCLRPAAVDIHPDRLATRFARAGGTAGTVVAAVLFGTVVWAVAFDQHSSEEAGGGLASGFDPVPAAEAAGHDDGHEHSDGHSPGHSHSHAARAQAGVLMRETDRGAPTAEQRRAADELAARTRAATAKYADIRAARADGYAASFDSSGYDVHLENKENQRDGRTLVPEKPEMLVYAIDGGKATLLGVVYQVTNAGEAGPEIGGSITEWHAHNVCLSLLPPGFSVVSSYGNCPPFSITTTIGEMMHVWFVDNPAGPYVDDLDQSLRRSYHRAHGRPYRP